MASTIVFRRCINHRVTRKLNLEPNLEPKAAQIYQNQAKTQIESKI